MSTDRCQLVPRSRTEVTDPEIASEPANDKSAEEFSTSTCANMNRSRKATHQSDSESSVPSTSPTHTLTLFTKIAKIGSRQPESYPAELLSKISRVRPSILDGDSVAISCLYGSTLEQFKRAFFAVSTSQKSVEQVTFSHVDFSDATLPAKLFHGPYARIRIISIDKCAQSASLNIHDDAFHGLAEQLEELYITDCNLEQFPRMAIQDLTKLKSLSLAHNKITGLQKEDLQPFQQLETLNLEGNFISSLENGTLSVLRNTLTTLHFGSHNFVNESAFSEISQLAELQVLDMEQADGITNIPQGAFQGLNKLEKLLLSGCSLTVIQKDTFQGLTQLKHLDLRINLLAEVECESFAWTPNLRRLSLAGNYLNESFACWWDGLEHLKELDLGWNEFTSLENDAFAKLGPTLGNLNLRHNTRLIQINDDAFNGLNNLRRLNLSETSITELNNTLTHLSSLMELDLSNGKLQQVDDRDLEAQAERLERLLLRGNQLTKISRNVLENMKKLQEMDLSNNPWLCDEDMESVVEEIELKYKEAVLLDREFMFLHANETICDRPFNLRGQIVTNVIKQAFKKYNSTEDVLPSTSAAPTEEDSIKFEDINATAISELLAKGGLIGDENTKAEHHQQDTSGPVRPQYDVNMRTEVVNERNRTNSTTPTIVAVAMLFLVSIAVTAAVVRHLKSDRWYKAAKAFKDCEDRSQITIYPVKKATHRLISTSLNRYTI